MQQWDAAFRSTLLKTKKGKVAPRLELLQSVHFLKIEDVVPPDFDKVAEEIKETILMGRLEPSERRRAVR